MRIISTTKIYHQLINNPSLLRKLYILFIVPYIIFMLYAMFVGFGREQMDDNIVRLMPIASTFHFVMQSILLETILMNIIGNMIMFMPFGFLGLLLPKFNDFKMLMINFVSVIILLESLQYFTRLGIFDIDDILLNSVGLALGFLLYKKVALQFLLIK